MTLHNRAEVRDAADAFEMALYPFVLLAPDLTIVNANNAFLKVGGKSREQVVGCNLFEAFPTESNNEDAANAQKIRASVAKVFRTGQADTLMFLRYCIKRETTIGEVFDERYWSVVSTPLMGDNGNVRLVLHHPIDVTDLYLLRNSVSPMHGERDLDFLTEVSVLDIGRSLEAANRLLDEERLQLRRIFDQAPGFIAILRGPSHVYDMVNEAYYRLVGHRDLIGRSVRDALPELTGQGYFELLDQVFKSGEPFVGHQMVVQVKRASDMSTEEIYIDFLFQPLLAPDGNVSGIFVQGNDITAQKRAEQALHISTERWKLAIEEAKDGVWDWTISTNEAVFSKRWKEILGYNNDEIANRFDEWESRIHPYDKEAAMEALQSSLNGSPYYYEHRLRSKDGSWKWVLARAVVVSRDGRGAPVFVTGTMTDISQQKKSEELAWRHASFDPLTGLPNRRLFRDRLDQEIRKVEGTNNHVALLCIDLDHFKEVNDLLGHVAGDLLLNEAAKRLTSCIGDCDTAARLGGDEFIVVLPNKNSRANIEHVAHRIIEAFQLPFRLGNETTHVSATVGITLYPDDATDPNELLRNAEQAMYAAKHAGRSRFRYFTRAMQREAHKRVRLAQDLREAVSNSELEVYFQPIFELSTRRIEKAEALLRWHHPRLGIVPPTEFIPIAEEFGIINEIGDWVFRQAVRQCKTCQDMTGHRFEISVNRSPVQFVGQASQMDWQAFIKRAGLPPDSVTVEITESTLLNASSNVIEALMEYRDVGIQVALDDFGTGYSSMSYLVKFHIDYIKIDQSFVRGIKESPDSRTIVESMIVMAHRLGLKVIAEGVETVEQEAFLREAGCNFGQGYLFSKPLTADGLIQLLVSAENSEQTDGC